MRFLFYLALFYLLFRLFFRYVLPYLLKWFVKNEFKKAAKRSQPKPGKEGEIRIHKNESKRNPDKGGGEYIDFEEIE